MSMMVILDWEKNWFERGVKECVMVRTKNPSLNYNGSTRITLSHSWDHSINTLRSFSPFPKNSEVRNQPEDYANTSCLNNHKPEED